ncbi:hypothetical protein [Clostridium beijerinckii]|nr:hypothetical protein [Clostridium beijerinckii]
MFLARNGCSIGYIDRFILKYRKGGISNNRNPMIDKMFNDDLELIRKK